MELTRILKRCRSGADVKAVKDRLVELGYLHASTHNIYGNDTFRAVKAFQAANNLDVDGMVGPLTWAALFPVSASDEPGKPVEPPSHIGVTARQAIKLALSQVSSLRADICVDALQHCVDPYADRIDLRSFYIRGGNLYNKDLTPNVMTAAKLNSYLRRADYAPYYDDGRDAMMRAQALRSGYTQTGADCSGGVVGLWRKHKVKSSGFDASANTLYSSYCVQMKNPKPGDLAWRSGHIGIVVGGGYVVEWIGGAYGCQLTKINDRRAYNYVDKKMHRFSQWSAFGDPKAY